MRSSSRSSGSNSNSSSRSYSSSSSSSSNNNNAARGVAPFIKGKQRNEEEVEVVMEGGREGWIVDRVISEERWERSQQQKSSSSI